MTDDELMSVLTRLRCARIESRQAPHKPLLLLWLLGRFADSSTTAVTYEEAEEPVSGLINEFGPAVRSRSSARERAAMPFVHLERELWNLRGNNGESIGPDAPERGKWLREQGAHGRLRPPVEQLLAAPATLAGAARLLLDQYFAPALRGPVRKAAHLDLPFVEDPRTAQS